LFSFKTIQMASIVPDIEIINPLAKSLDSFKTQFDFKRLLEPSKGLRDFITAEKEQAEQFRKAILEPIKGLRDLVKPQQSPINHVCTSDSEPLLLQCPMYRKLKDAQQKFDHPRRRFGFNQS
jgi:hypothetical protein